MENNQITEDGFTDPICFSELTQDEFIYRFRYVDATDGDPSLLIDIFNHYNSREHLRYKSYPFEDVLQWIDNALMFG